VGLGSYGFDGHSGPGPVRPGAQGPGRIDLIHTNSQSEGYPCTGYLAPVRVGLLVAVGHAVVGSSSSSLADRGPWTLDPDRGTQTRGPGPRTRVPSDHIHVVFAHVCVCDNVTVCTYVSTYVCMYVCVCAN